MKKEKYWFKALEVSKIAKECGALIPMETRLIKFESGEYFDFELRELISKFPKLLKAKNYTINPFLPADSNLLVEKIKSEYLIILNKYPVEKGHMLLITSEYKPQNGWLSKYDFETIEGIEEDTSGLWFFNSSPESGASQGHRHIQLLRRNNNEIVCPRSIWFEQFDSNILNNTDLNNSVRVIQRKALNGANKKPDLYKCYLKLSMDLNIGNPEFDNKPKCPYNLLISENWIAIIRRSKENYLGFSINGLGFAGYLLSTSERATKSYIKMKGEHILNGVVSPK